MFKDIDGGVDDAKALLHDKRWVLRYRRSKLKLRSNAITVSISCYGLIRILVLKVISIRWTCRMILMRRRWTMSI